MPPLKRRGPRDNRRKQQEQEPQEGQPFNKKYYEAALAARIRSTNDLPIPIEVVSKSSAINREKNQAQQRGPEPPSYGPESSSTAQAAKPRERGLSQASKSLQQQHQELRQNIFQENHDGGDGGYLQGSDLKKANDASRPVKEAAFSGRRTQAEHARRNDSKGPSEGVFGSLGSSSSNKRESTPSRARSGRGRTPSRVVKERLRQFSQGPCNKLLSSSTALRHDSRKARSQSQEPTKTRITLTSRGRNDSMSSIERLALEFSGNVEHLQASEPAVSAPPPQNNQQQGPQSPSPRLPDGGRNQTSFHKRSTSLEFNSSEEKTIEKPKAHSDVVGYWNQKVKASPVSTTSNKPPIGRNPNPSSWRQDSYSCLSPVAGTRSEATTSAEKRDIAQLVAKLTSIDRGNPTLALAQIDNILRQESRGSSASPDELVDGRGATAGKESPTQQRESAPEEDALDDDTTVSSITNPTYQSEKIIVQRPSKQRSSRISNNNTNNKSETQALLKHQSPSTNSFAHPSTSSFRRPRPSALQRFGGLTHDGLTFEQQPQQRHEELRRGIESRPIDFPQIGPSKEEVARTHPEIMPSKREGKLDDFIRYKEELATKIKNWDEMSKSRSSESDMNGKGFEFLDKDNQAAPAHLPTPPTGDSRRRHPWDERIPARAEKVVMRATSMDGEMGIETEMTTRGGSEYRPSDSHDYEDHQQAIELSSAGSKDRAQQSIQSAVVNAKPQVEPISTQRSNHGSASDSAFVGQHTPSDWEAMPPLSSLQKENAEKISADFDAAWVSIPASSFFPDELLPEKPEPRHSSHASRAARPERSRSQPPRSGQQSRNSDPVDMNLSGALSANQSLSSWSKCDDVVANQSVEKDAIEVSLLDPSFGLKNLSGALGEEAIHRSLPSQRACSLVKSSGKKKGFLRSFMRRSEKKQRKDAAKNKTSVNSVSQGSAGVQSLPTNLSRALEGQPEQQAAVRAMPCPPGFDPNNETELQSPPSRAKQSWQSVIGWSSVFSIPFYGTIPQSKDCTKIQPCYEIV